MSAAPVQKARSRVIEGTNPFGVDPGRDLLSEPRHDDPAWSETMFFVVWDPDNGIGTWLHMGTVPEDKGMWWAQTYLMLPGEVVLVDRSFGRPADNRGPDTGNLKVRSTEPGQSWTLSFDGAGEISSSSELAKRLVGAGVAAPFSFDLELDAVSPIYDMHQAIEEDIDWDMGRIHHEQGLTAKGTMSARGQTWDFKGMAIRDHSVGPRDFTRFGGHAWSFAVFPLSRRAVGAFVMWRPGTLEVNATVGVIIGPGGAEICSDVVLTGISERGGHPREMSISMIRPDGSRLDFHGEGVHNVTMTYALPNHNLNGAVDDDQLVADETVTRWTWPDGEVGYGNTERNFAASSLPRVDVPLPADSPFLDDRP